MKQKVFAAVVTAAFLLSACTLPFFVQPSPEAGPPAEATPTALATSGDLATLPAVPVDLLGPEPAAGTKLRWYDGSMLIYVPSGKFIMGHGEPDNPIHEVTLDGFWIYRTKVTNDMYARCVAAGKCSPPGPDAGLPDYTDPSLKDRPVVGVRWEQAEDYCNWMEGRLPTEAEWEKTARGPNGKIYPWGDAAPDCNLANFSGCVGHLSDVLDYPAGMSEYEAFDMTGNAFEWVQDWYDPMYYIQSPPTANPTGPQIGNVRSVRGSAYLSPADRLQPSIRYFYEPEKFRPDLGFRCVIEDALKYAPPCVVTPFVGESGSGTPADFGCEPPPLNVTVATYCQNKKPYANINLNGASDLDTGGASCSPSGDLMVCTGSDNQTFHMSACTTCDVDGGPPSSVPPSCPAGYTYDDAACQCRYTGGSTSVGTICPTGLTALYVPEQQCCQLPPDGSKPFCDPGYILDGCKCVIVPLMQPFSCDEFTVSLPDCSKERSCRGCGCYTTLRECVAHANQGCWWDTGTSQCRP